MGWRTFIEQADFSRNLLVMVLRERDDGRRETVLPLTIQVHEPDAFIGDKHTIAAPNSVDVRGMLQSIVDACWDFGIRPTGAQDSASELKATGRHLEDMRRLVFKEHEPQIIQIQPDGFR